jgi:lipopolysaccharide/colanic/teichoic acid biosynthesis glycosyltransferase
MPIRYPQAPWPTTGASLIPVRRGGCHVGQVARVKRDAMTVRQPVGTLHRRPALSRRPPVSKRAFDLCVAVLALVLLAPLLGLIAVAIQIDSPGSALYTQLRAGRARRTFRMYKFRTMVVDADARLGDVLHLDLHAGEHGDPRLYKIASDPRVTRVGAFLRRYSLDELPQLVNVVRGDMSLVGPRPLMLAEDRHVDGPARIRATVKPGITGPWQVGGRNERSFEEMMMLDSTYVTNWSLAGDLRLLAQTIPVVLRPQRAC